MNPQIKEKFQKVIALVERGGTEGEKQAANKALERLMLKYNVSDAMLANIELNRYSFTYKTEIDQWLLVQVARVLAGYKGRFEKHTNGQRVIKIYLKYEDWITVDCAYEYFRRHAAAQYRKIVLPELKKCRTTKTRNKRRNELMSWFLATYISQSKLYLEGDLKQVEPHKISQQELRDRCLMNEVEGGQYHKQVVTTNLLEA